VAATATGSSGLAQRYANALLELAEGAKALDKVADDLKALHTAMAESADLRMLVRSPLLTRNEQMKAMAAVLDKAGADDLTSKFVGLVASNRRLFALDAMITAYLEELARRRGEITAEVTSAHELTDDQTQALTDQIKKVVGSKVTIDKTVDPSLLGGMIVRVGSRMVDSSLRTKLNKMQLAMKGIG